MQRFSSLLLLTCSVTAAFVPPHHDHRAIIGSSMRRVVVLQMVDNQDDDEPNEKKIEPEDIEAVQSKSESDRYDVSKLVGGSTEDGSGGFNQFDPVLSATGFLSRRFGILGGLAIFAALALVEGGEILKSFDDVTPLEGSGKTVTTPSGLQITETRIGKAGSVPLPGYIIGLKAVVSIGDKEIFNTAGDKPIAFKFGQRPFQNVICEGVEEGIQGMKVGGKRVLNVPGSLAPPGVVLPPGVPLIYEVELTEVLSGYF
jgi:hypothetical protein